jgi:uncharacterized protein YutE (UPF0331/DUF86 family)
MIAGSSPVRPEAGLALDREVVAARLAVLDENLRLLESFARLDLPTYLADPRNYGAAERFLQLSIEAVLDIGTHCISALGLPRPATYGDILPVLAQAGLVTPRTLEELANVAGFRNLLVHDYVRLDRSRVHAFLTTRLGAFRRFAAEITRLF